MLVFSCHKIFGKIFLVNYFYYFCPYMQRKVPIKRSKPLVRRSYLRGNYTKIERNSQKTKSKLEIYYLLRPIYLLFFPDCGINLPGCTRIATEIHHKQGRGRYLLAVFTWVSACRRCHDEVGVHSCQAIKDGHSLSRVKKHHTVSGIQKHDGRVISFLIKVSNILKLEIHNTL
jgi:hypothetical protein